MWVDERIKLDEIILGLILWNAILLSEADELLNLAVIALDLEDQQE